MSNRPYHQQLSLDNFTAFKSLTLNFVPGVNAFVGENGTGKSHLMKVMYAKQLALSRERLGLDEALLRLFQVTALGELEFDFSGAEQPVERPDRLANPLKSVDFIVRAGNDTWLIEVKDPESKIARQRNPGAIGGFTKELQSGALVKQHLLPKLYGTYAYLALSGREPKGGVRYAVVIGHSGLSAAERMVVTDTLQRVIDRVGPKTRGSRYWPVVEVHNLASWEEAYPSMAARRLP